jgi:drug/metabolite transporter (DMT)-like permease
VTYLMAASSVWAFSFGLIKGHLTGLDSNLVAAIRMAISLLVLLPFFRPAALPARRAAAGAAIGAVQFGVMYIAYIYSFRHLQAYEVAVLTITTPLYVTMLHDVSARRLNPRHLLGALLAILGAAVVVVSSAPLPQTVMGVAAVQASNLCFAFGQLAYARVFGAPGSGASHGHFAVLYAGALAVTGGAAAVSVDWAQVRIAPTQWLVLAYLGAVASGLCFLLWNSGARRVNPGTLAVFNNVKIPLAVACSLAFFGERADLLRLAVGGGVMGLALVVAEARSGRGRAAPQPAAA